MHRRNRDAVRVRPVRVASNDFEGRSICRECGQPAPRGQDRPFCLDHAPYAKTLRGLLAAAPHRVLG
jgi:hypothetical protein